jgi:anti-anti-sigma factor
VGSRSQTPAGPLSGGSRRDKLVSLLNLRANQSSEPARLHVVEVRGATCVSFPRQKIDGVAVRELYEVAMAMTDGQHPKLLIDLTGVAMIPSGAVGIILAIRKKFLQCGGQVHIAGADPLVMQSLEVMSLHRLLRVFSTADEAIAAFK